MRKTRLAALIGMLFPAIAGATPSVADLGAMPDQTSLINALQSINPWPAATYNAANNTTAFTATPAQIMSAQDTVLELTGTIGSGQALTLPTAAAMLAAMTPAQAVVGSTTILRIGRGANGAFNWTVTTAAGWTLNGTMTIAQSTYRDFIATVTGVGGSAAISLQSIGTGTWS